MSELDTFLGILGDLFVAAVKDDARANRRAAAEPESTYASKRVRHGSGRRPGGMACFNCHHRWQVSPGAASTTCPKCSSDWVTTF